MTLDSNKINYKGLIGIMKSLENNKALMILDLSNNEIVFEGDDQLSSVFLSNDSLKVLDLCNFQKQIFK